MAIDLAQIQRQVIERAQSRLTEDANRSGDVDPGRGAARFEQLMESPRGGAGGPDDPAAANAGPGHAQPADRVTGAGTPPVVGDRILANLHGSPLQMPDLAGTQATGRVGATPGIDIGDPENRLALQIKVAEIKTEVGLATTTVQKASQGVDTLLKSQ